MLIIIYIYLFLKIEFVLLNCHLVLDEFNKNKYPFLLNNGNHVCDLGKNRIKSEILYIIKLTKTTKFFQINTNVGKTDLYNDCQTPNKYSQIAVVFKFEDLVTATKQKAKANHKMLK